MEVNNPWGKIGQKLIFFFLSYSLGLIFISMGLSLMLVNLSRKDNIDSLPPKVNYFENLDLRDLPKDEFEDTLKDVPGDVPKSVSEDTSKDIFGDIPKDALEDTIRDILPDQPLPEQHRTLNKGKKK